MRDEEKELLAKQLAWYQQEDRERQRAVAGTSSALVVGIAVLAILGLLYMIGAPLLPTVGG